MTILDKLEEVESKFCRNNTIWLYDEKDNQLTDALEEAFKEFNIDQYSVIQDECFDNPGITTGVVSVAWIENGLLNHYNIIYTHC